MENLTNFKQNYSTLEVADNYGVSQKAIRDHFTRHGDELIKNIHYFYTINPRFKTKILNWTLEGVYMLGFFIKSPQAKIYRKKVAEFLRICDEARQKRFSEARQTIANQSDKIANLEAVAISKQRHHNLQINGYKSQLSQRKNQIYALKKDLAKKDFFIKDFKKVDFDAFNQLFQIAIYDVLKDTKKALYQKSREITTLFDTTQNYFKDGTRKDLL